MLSWTKRVPVTSRVSILSLAPTAIAMDW
jgi:hypothetical protein